MRLERIAHGSFSWSNPMLGITFWLAELRGTKPRKFLDIGVVWTDRSNPAGGCLCGPCERRPLSLQTHGPRGFSRAFHYLEPL